MHRYGGSNPGTRIPVVALLTFVWFGFTACDSGTDPNTVTAVTVSPGSVVLESLGDTTRLVATAQTVGGTTVAAPEVLWTSSDSAVATVDPSGLVTAVANGGATIRATTAGVTGSAAVAVDQRAVAVAIEAPADTLVSLGETMQLTATARDSLDRTLTTPAYTWSSSDTDVLTVSDEGIVTAQGNGAAEVVALIQEVADTLELVVRQEPEALAVVTQPGETVAQTAVAPGVAVEIRDALGSRVDFADNVVTIAIAANPGAGSLSGTTAFAASEGSVTFPDLSIDEAAAGYTLVATAEGLEPATTATFSVLIHFSRMSASGVSTCGVDIMGRAYCWGEGSDGRLGTGSEDPRPVPTRVVGGFTFREVSAGGATACAVTIDDEGYCWGSNSVGQLGNGGGGDSPNPVPVSGGLAFTSIDTGGGTSCGVTVEGAGYCWGNGVSGELGDGGTPQSDVPVPVSGDLDWSEIRVGDSHVCGVTTGGTAYCWGDNEYGQLGDGSTSPRSEPTAVEGGLVFETVSLAGQHTCGIATGSDVYCWGAGSLGQLGDGLEAESDVPVLVSGGLDGLVITVGGTEGQSATSCAVTTSSDAFCWGRGSLGVQGGGQSAVPVPVEGDLSFLAISAGSFHACGIGSTGAGVCWGSDTSGQLGTGGGNEDVPRRVLPPEM